MTIAATLAVCIGLAAHHYSIKPARLDLAISAASQSASPQGVGVTGIPSAWMPILSKYGFDDSRVRSDDCQNVAAAAWILAYTDRINAERARWAARQLPARARAWQTTIDWVASRAGMDPALINAVIDQESGFNPQARSPQDAIGLMQIWAPNARKWNINPWNPAENIWAGTWYLKYLLQHYRGDLTLALAAYNSGEANVARYGGVPPFRETQNYVPSVERKFQGYEALQDAPGGRR